MHSVWKGSLVGRKVSASASAVAWFQAWIRVEVPKGDKLEDKKFSDLIFGRDLVVTPV